MGLTKLTDYYRPKKLTEAIRLLRENEGYFPIGGGTWLIPFGGSDVKGIVDLCDAGFSEIRLEENLMYIGASTTLSKLLTSPETSAYPYKFLRDTIAAEGSSGLINSASTIGGRIALARSDSPLLAGLVAVDASLVIFGNINDDIKLWDYLTVPELQRGNHIISGIEIHNPENVHSVIFDSISYIPSSPPLLSLALYLTFSGNLIDSVRIVFSSIGENLIRLEEAETKLVGNELRSDLIKEVSEMVAADINPQPDPKASPAYKKAMAGVLLKRALDKINVHRGGS